MRLKFIPIVHLLLLFCFKAAAVELSSYYGTFQGKFSEVAPDNLSFVKDNELSITISGPDKISIAFKLKFSNYKNPASEYMYLTGTVSGRINDDLTYDFTGKIEKEIAWGLNPQNEIDISRENRTAYFKGLIKNDVIIGDIFLGERDKSLPLTYGKGPGSFILPLTSSGVINTGETCSCAISLPAEVVPGKDFYVVPVTNGCAKSYVLYYNGKQNPITNWDGKAVEVGVQMTCCNGDIIDEKFMVPAYGSGEVIKPASDEKSTLPEPKAKEIIVGTAIAAAIAKALEVLVNMKFPKTKIPPSKPPVKPKKHKHNQLPVAPVLPPKEWWLIPPPAVMFQNDLTRAAAEKDLRRLHAALEKNRREALAAAHKVLLANSEATNLVVDNRELSISGQVQQAIVETHDQLAEAGSKIYSGVRAAGQKTIELVADITEDAEERNRLTNNIRDTFINGRNMIFDYVYTGTASTDFSTFTTNLAEINAMFIDNLWNHPIDTTKAFFSTALGYEDFKIALDPNVPYEKRWMHLGLGCFKTGTTAMTGASGSIGWNLFKQQTTLIMQQYQDDIPGFLQAVKEEITYAAIAVQAPHAISEKLVPKFFGSLIWQNPSMVKTSALIDLNNLIEYINRRGGMVDQGWFDKGADLHTVHNKPNI